MTTTAQTVLLAGSNGALSGVLTLVIPVGLLAVVGAWAGWARRHGR